MQPWEVGIQEGKPGASRAGELDFPAGTMPALFLTWPAGHTDPHGGPVLARWGEGPATAKQDLWEVCFFQLPGRLRSSAGAGDK